MLSALLLFAVLALQLWAAGAYRLTGVGDAPLWSLFRHKPWQKVLKDTWAKLEKGDYDWAHLAINYWPERVRDKCKTDKSLAIAHGLEDLYIEPEAAPKKTRGRKKTGGDE